MDCFKADWIARAPPLGELVKDIQDGRKGKRAKTAIIIPSFRRPDLLSQHATLLRKQSMADFDIISVYGTDDGYIQPPPGIGMVHIRRKIDIGSAGAFYIGELYALNEGYEILVIADDDCLPTSDSLLQELDRALEGTGGSSPWVRFTPDRWRSEGVISMYRAYRREVFEKVGLTFLPFYTSAEDLDLMWRIKRGGIRTAQTDELVTHPKQMPPFLCSRYRIHHYGRNHINLLLLQGDIAVAMASFFIESMTILAYKVLGNKIAGAYWEVLLSETSFTLFYEEKKGVSGEFVLKDDKVRDDFDVVVRREREDDEHISPTYCIHDQVHPKPVGIPSKSQSRISQLFSISGKAISCFDKDVLFDGTWLYTDILTVLFSRSSFVRWDGKTYRITDRRGPLSIFGHLLALTIAAAPVGIFSVFLTGHAFLKARGVTTRGYGKELIKRKTRTL